MTMLRGDGQSTFTRRFTPKHNMPGNECERYEEDGNDVD